MRLMVLTVTEGAETNTNDLDKLPRQGLSLSDLAEVLDKVSEMGGRGGM